MASWYENALGFCIVANKDQLVMNHLALHGAGQRQVFTGVGRFFIGVETPIYGGPLRRGYIHGPNAQDILGGLIEKNKFSGAVGDDHTDLCPGCLFYCLFDPAGTCIGIHRERGYAARRGVGCVHTGIREECPAFHAEQEAGYPANNRVAFPENDLCSGRVNVVHCRQSQCMG